MQFYKERDFGELFSDTFDFIKIYGKNYFKNYIIINGLVIILLVVVFYFGFGELFQQLFSSNLDGQQFFFENYFQENQGVLVFSFILLLSIFILLSLISYSYPVLYLKRVSETGAKELSVNQIVEDIKGKAGKFVKFLIGMIFIVTPVMFIVMALSGLLMIVIIGFFLLLFAIPAMINIINFALFHYYHTDARFFSSLSYGVRQQFSKKFWKYWGSVTIIYLIIQVVTSIFSSLPIFLIMLGTEMMDPSKTSGDVDMFVVLTFMIYIMSFVVSFILTNMVSINAGLMYYDSRTDLHRDMQFSEIENIGTGEI